MLAGKYSGNHRYLLQLFPHTGFRSTIIDRKSSFSLAFDNTVGMVQVMDLLDHYERAKYDSDTYN